MKVNYEWTVEMIDVHEDIVDSHFFDNLADAMDFAVRCGQDDCDIAKTDIGLVRNGDDGTAWAYIKDGKLDQYLRDAYQNALYNVPKKYLKESARVLSAVVSE